MEKIDYYEMDKQGFGQFNDDSIISSSNLDNTTAFINNVERKNTMI